MILKLQKLSKKWMKLMSKNFVGQVLSYFIIFWSNSLSTTLCSGFLILRIPRNMWFKTARTQNSVINDDIVMIVMSKHLIKIVLSYFGAYSGLLSALFRCLDAVTTQTYTKLVWVLSKQIFATLSGSLSTISYLVWHLICVIFSPCP